MDPAPARTGIGTVLNVLLVGPSAEVCLAVAAAGPIVGTGAAGRRHGALPRRPARTWAARRTHDGDAPPLRLAHQGGPTGIGLAALAAGWVLGGTVGPGTVAFALLVGPPVNRAPPLFDIRSLAPGREKASGG